MDTKLLVLSKNSHKIREELSVSLQRRIGMSFFTKVAMLDPTTRKNVGNVLVVGEYATWIAKRFFTDIEQDRVSIEKFFREDADKVTPDLRVYHAKKSSLKVEQQDINNIDGFVALYQAVQMLRKVRSKRQQKKEVMKDVIELPTGNPNKRVLIPTSKMAAIAIQSNDTRWCTGATKSPNKFDSYFGQGFLYDVFIRNTESNKIDKYQFHFENREFMNELDQRIDDVHGFFKEHQEVANAIAEHREQLFVAKSESSVGDKLVPELLLLNQRLSDFDLVRNLTELNLSCSKIIDLTPLEGLEQLRKLQLAENRIVDLSPLKRLTNLRELYLADNQISDITPLQELTQLTRLRLSYNQVVDITPLKGLTQLKRLFLKGNPVVNTKLLDELTQLEGNPLLEY